MMLLIIDVKHLHKKGRVAKTRGNWNCWFRRKNISHNWNKYNYSNLINFQTNYFLTNSMFSQFSIKFFHRKRKKNVVQKLANIQSKNAFCKPWIISALQKAIVIWHKSKWCTILHVIFLRLPWNEKATWKIFHVFDVPPPIFIFLGS